VEELPQGRYLIPAVALEPAAAATDNQTPAANHLASGSRHIQSRSIVSIPVWLHDDLHILIERNEESHKALNRKLPEFATQHLGDVGLFDPEKIGSLHLFQAAILHDRVDFENELRLYQVLFGIRQANILEYIPAPSLVSPLPHGSLSFAIR
jgi:hypothetical protein